jgi:DNA-binding FadR family transcriptional regulator
MIGPEICSKFFRMLAMRKTPEAEQELQKIQTKLDKSRDDLGYFRALEGLVLTQKSGDKNLYLSGVNLNENSARQIKREFLAHASNELHEEYDRAYFRALADYIRAVEDQKPWEQTSKPDEKYVDEIEEETDTTRP